MGRRGQPAAVKEAKGNPGRRPIAKEGPATPASTFGAPRDMTAKQRALWNAIAPELGAMRILRPSDLTPFRRYVVLVDRWAEAERKLRTAQLVSVTKSEHVTMERMGQWLKVALMLDKRLSEIEDRFGMNPAARQRLMLQMAQQGSLPLGQPEQPKQEDGEKAASVEGLPLPESPIGLLN